MPEEPEVIQVQDERRVYFFIIDNEVLDDHKLSPGAFWLYAKLVRIAGKNASCFPSLNTLAVAGDCSRGTIVNWRKELVDAKLIKFETRETEKSGHSNTKYIIKEVSKKHPPCQSADKPPCQSADTPLSATEHVRIYKREEDKEIETTPQIDTTQDIIPFIEKHWDEHQRTLPKSLRHKLNLGPFPEQFVRQEEALGKEPYRRLILTYIPSPENKGMVHFVKMTSPEVPRKPRNGNGNGNSNHPKTITERMMELHPELVGK
jgi:hypothetical protein